MHLIKDLRNKHTTKNLRNKHTRWLNMLTRKIEPEVMYVKLQAEHGCDKHDPGHESDKLESEHVCDIFRAPTKNSSACASTSFRVARLVERPSQTS